MKGLHFDFQRWNREKRNEIKVSNSPYSTFYFGQQWPTPTEKHNLRVTGGIPEQDGDQSSVLSIGYDTTANGYRCVAPTQHLAFAIDKKIILRQLLTTFSKIP